MVYWTTRFIIQIVTAILLKVEVRGLNNLPKNGPAILVSNHRSMMDGPFLSGVIPRKMHSFIQADYFKRPLANWFLYKIQGIPVKNEKLNHSSFKAAKSVLTQNKLLTIFPEGGIDPNVPVSSFKSSFVRLAMHYSVPVIPIAILGTDRSLPVKTKFPRPAKVYIEFMEPLFIEKNKDPEVTEKITGKIRGLILSKLTAARENGA